MAAHWALIRDDSDVIEKLFRIVVVATSARMQDRVFHKIITFILTHSSCSGQRYNRVNLMLTADAPDLTLMFLCSLVAVALVVSALA